MWFAVIRVTTERGYGCASVAVRAEKRAVKYDKMIVLFSETETTKQNQKIPFHFFGSPHTPRRGNKKGEEMFWVLHHASPRACPRRIGSHHSAIGANDAVSSHHALRACDWFARNTFELCTMNTAQRLGFLCFSMTHGLGTA